MVSDRWAALVNLSVERRERLGAILAGVGVRAVAVGWDRPVDQVAADQVSSIRPVLVVAPSEEYSRENSRLAWCCPSPSQVVVALLVPAALTHDTLRMQIHHDVLNVIPDGLWDDPVCLERTVRGLLFPGEMFEMSRFVPNAAVFERCQITSAAEKRQVADKMGELARPFGVAPRRIRDIRLVVTELINNALFHSFLNDHGEKKYSPRHFQRLDEDDRVLLEAAVGEGTVAFAVEDNRGTLSPRDVLKYLQRQTTGVGAYDSHGRGFYLICSLMDHLNICLTPGKRARVVAVSHIGATSPIRTLNFFVSR